MKKIISIMLIFVLTLCAWNPSMGTGTMASAEVIFEDAYDMFQLDDDYFVDYVSAPQDNLALDILGDGFNGAGEDSEIVFEMENLQDNLALDFLDDGFNGAREDSEIVFEMENLLDDGENLEMVEDAVPDIGIQLSEKAVILQEPANALGLVGDTVVFHIIAANAIGYQWKFSIDGSNFIDVETNDDLEDGQIEDFIDISDDLNIIDFSEEEVMEVMEGIEEPISFEDVDFIDIIDEMPPVQIGENFISENICWGSKTDTLKVKITDENKGYYWLCVVTGTDGSEIASRVVKIEAPENKNEAEFIITQEVGSIETEEVEAASVTSVNITSQPSSVTAEVGEIVYFQVNASGEGLTYQWQMSKDNGVTWTNTTLSGAKTKKLKVSVTTERNRYSYRCIITGGSESVASNAAVLSVAGIATITSQPANVLTEVGETVYFRVGTYGENLTYQWQLSKDNGTTWTNTTLSGAKTNKLKVVASIGRNGYQFRCIVNGAANNVTSEAAKLTIAGVVSISSQPEDVTAEVGETVYFQITAEGDAPSYQWQMSKDNGETWSNTTLSGAKTKKLKVTASVGRDGYLYRCVVTEAANSVISEGAKLNINGVVKIVAQPEDVEAEVGDTVYFVVTAEGESVAYQWQTSKDNGATWNNTTLSGSKTKKLRVVVSAGRNGNLYRCVVTGAANNVTSNAAELKVSGFASITTQPQDIEAETGETVYFVVAAEGEGLTYQWQTSKDDGATWSNTTLSGSKTKKLKVVVTEGRNGYLFRCVVTGTVNTVTSEPARLSVIVSIVVNGVTFEPVSSNTLAAVSYSGTGESLVIPETITSNGVTYTVTEIGAEAFMGNTNLRSIDLPDTITVIRARAFKNCSNLSEMN